jgi:hypothetical protein
MPLPLNAGDLGLIGSVEPEVHRRIHRGVTVMISQPDRLVGACMPNELRFGPGASVEGASSWNFQLRYLKNSALSAFHCGVPFTQIRSTREGDADNAEHSRHGRDFGVSCQVSLP